ncbi:hypothetical protein Tco_0356473 [Tanacetum coccineum]
MLGASRVQIRQNNLNNLQSIREEDGTSETVDPQDCLGSLVLEVLDSTILALLLDPIDLDAFGFLLYTLSARDCVIIGVTVVSLRGTSLVEVIVVKGHLFWTIVKVLPEEPRYVGKSSPFKMSSFGKLFELDFSKEKVFLPLLWIIVQVTLLLLTAWRETHVEMLQPLGSEEGPFTGPSTWPSTGPSTGPSRRRSGGFKEKAGGLLRTQQWLDAVSVLGEGWPFPYASFIIICLYLYLNFFEGHTPKGVGLRVADFHIGNHREDDFMTSETFEGFPSAFGM